MTVTFIAHSAYLVEWDKFYTLFDYTYEPDYTGALPELNPESPCSSLRATATRTTSTPRCSHFWKSTPTRAFSFRAIRASPSASGNG